MRTTTKHRRDIDICLPFSSPDFTDDAIERVTRARLIGGNEVELLVDAAENYPAWLDAIANAHEYIYFESYIIHEDEQGRIFAEALIEKARQGVTVKVLYDWLGGFGKTSRAYWNRLRAGGIDVRVYNPPNLLDPLSFLTRDHRKVLVTDGDTAFVTGLCVGQDWVGHPAREVPGWRDTGVKITGPAVSEVEASFDDVWAVAGGEAAKKAVNRDGKRPKRGDVALRVVRSVPGAVHLYRLDQLLAATAKESMWLTDAYFIGLPSYLQSLKSAAEDGVDVRVLVPQSTDITLIRDTTRSTYRPLLESGVRVFEWNGPMMHAKTAVFDGKFARVGSTNLNVASWFGNYELDVLVEDDGFGQKMMEMFVRDIGNSTEIVLSDTVRRKGVRRQPRRHGRRGGGSVRKATAGALNAATSIGSAITQSMALGSAEARLLGMVGTALLVIAILFIFFPRAASIPVIIVLVMLAIPTLVKAVKNYRQG